MLVLSIFSISHNVLKGFSIKVDKTRDCLVTGSPLTCRTEIVNGYKCKFKLVIYCIWSTEVNEIVAGSA